MIVSFVCVISLIIGIVSLYENELYSIKQNHILMYLAGLIILEIFIDTIAMSIDGLASEQIFYYKHLKIIEFITVPFIPALLSSLVARKKIWKKIRKYYIILISINTVAQCITIFTPFMFSINDNGNYGRTTFTYFYVIILILCLVLLVISSYKTFIQNNLKISLTLISINLLLLLGIFLRYFDMKSNADWLCITFGYFIFILDFGNSYLKIDTTTSLLNRRAFSNRIASIKFNTAIIIIDANNFKQINDNYGHQCGDWALSKIAEIIFNVYSNIGFCYRVGGDEFCVILKPDMLERLTSETENLDTFEMLDSLLDLVEKEISKQAEKHHALKYGVSQGYGIYYSLYNSQEFKEYKSPDEVLKMADKNMYERKKAYKKKNVPNLNKGV